MELENISIEEVLKIRGNLLKFGKKMALENPDKLTADELIALSAEIFKVMDKIDQGLGYAPHDTGIRVPEEIDEDRIQELFADFLDWYEVVPSPNKNIYRYIEENYPQSEYPKILCVGDGENSHLGRKLAMKGYTVVSVDPVARKEFSTSKNQQEKHKGSLHVTKAEFFKTSTPMIRWADVIVGSKIPLCAESLIGLSKPAIFNISENVTGYHMTFEGKPIYSSRHLADEMARSSCVKVVKKGEKVSDWIFVCNENEKELDER